MAGGKKRGVPPTDSAAEMFAAKSKASIYIVLIFLVAVLFAAKSKMSLYV